MVRTPLWSATWPTTPKQQYCEDRDPSYGLLRVTEEALEQAWCIEIYPKPARLLARFTSSLLGGDYSLVRLCHSPNVQVLEGGDAVVLQAL
jgi:hypothetical protein